MSKLAYREDSKMREREIEKLKLEKEALERDVFALLNPPSPPWWAYPFKSEDSLSDMARVASVASLPPLVVFAAHSGVLCAHLNLENVYFIFWIWFAHIFAPICAAFFWVRASWNLRPKGHAELTNGIYFPKKTLIARNEFGKYTALNIDSEELRRIEARSSALADGYLLSIIINRLNDSLEKRG